MWLPSPRPISPHLPSQTPLPLCKTQTISPSSLPLSPNLFIYFPPLSATPSLCSTFDIRRQTCKAVFTPAVYKTATKRPDVDTYIVADLEVWLNPSLISSCVVTMSMDHQHLWNNNNGLNAMEVGQRSVNNRNMFFCHCFHRSGMEGRLR